ncbi:MULTISPECIES: zinc-ribbon domain-containing protein [unclassified Methanobrevibacter]|mgnify:CR=1 FL=1|jgi:DNA-directed RNA polymerase subunit RPC12/RpoP|uniref:zinc-ribbon domain-containing protein n=1 Tax=unclassified Methanobrevibacter TaxID=2638681 RepID=UPI0039B8ECFD
MMINVYVNNKDELNRKVQEYTVQDYNIKFANDDTVVMKKKDYNLAIFIILLLLGIIFGLIYYLVSEETTVQIQIDPNRSNHQNTPTQPSSNTLPVSNTPNMSDTIFCTNCGSKILKTENFCPNCGYKKTVQHEKEN